MYSIFKITFEISRESQYQNYTKIQFKYGVGPLTKNTLNLPPEE